MELYEIEVQQNQDMDANVYKNDTFHDLTQLPRCYKQLPKVPGLQFDTSSDLRVVYIYVRLVGDAQIKKARKTNKYKVEDN